MAEREQEMISTQIEIEIRKDLRKALFESNMKDFNELCSILGDLLEERDDPEQRWCRLEYRLLKSETDMIITNPRLSPDKIPAPRNFERNRVRNNKRILCFDVDTLLTQPEFMYKRLENSFDLYVCDKWVIGKPFNFDLLLP